MLHTTSLSSNKIRALGDTEWLDKKKEAFLTQKNYVHKIYFLKKFV